ncbi:MULTISPECIES: alpha/beta fold hydrolase [Peribacillus]|uniref:alpha/beta fold hydrolase n=1 Tax=Peribacillus TaxID=2675229 RepID=UPI001F4E90A6|nr:MULTISPECIES: alpha/beta hydrolase [unclassified Peribacillus]MCK1985393.1 alpha/beta hydrolase [Peribacillus sp. Aquil_B1]MCK2007873.1 alpha/beta hydrolase [Peribacillus sp. Aquil_B8]
MKQPNLVVLPGWGMEKEVFQPLIQPLSELFHLSIIDWRDMKALNDFEERVIDTITSLDGPVYLLSWSLGSLVSLELSSSYREKIKGFILFGATSRFTTGENYSFGWDPRMVERMKKQLQRNKEKTLTSFYEAMFSDAEKEAGFYHQFIKTIQREFQGDDVFSLLIGLDYLLQKDARARLNRIEAPFILLHGREDKICPFEASSFIKENLGGKAELHIIEGAGHIPFFTKPQECTEHIKTFIQKEYVHDR